MKLKAACEIAESCGLETVGEAICNIEIHWVNLFTQDDKNDELQELYEDSKDIPDSTPISVILNGNKMNKVYLIWYDNGYVCVLDAVTTTEKLAKEFIDNADCSKYYSIEERELYLGEEN